MSKLFNKVKDKARDLAEDLPNDFRNLKTQVTTMYNPNHRHDEEHEKEQDRIREEICASHRFNSFGPERTGCHAKFYLDGHDYFWAVSEILESAKESIFILDWWLSPELYMRRPPAQHEEWRLDRILKRKAEQGVRICISIYKEVTQSMALSSAHTKHHLEDLHENIAVVRHPDHIGGETTLLWSHHEKLVIVDNAVACVGGLDLCFGRWDTHTSPLADAHIDNPEATLFPGQDFNNARVADFVEVDKWLRNQSDRFTSARMPWTDRHSMVTGPIVLDLAQHFCERWAFVRGLKYRHDSRYHLLAFPHVGDQEEDHIVRHPHFEQFKQGLKLTLHATPPPEGPLHGGMGEKGRMRIQALRSSADWSHGILTEHSIQNAYCQLISEASHNIFIENQFFVTATSADAKGPVKNIIGEAIVNRVLRAAKDGKKFKVIIVIPAVPGFAQTGDKESDGTLAIIFATYRSISRGDDSIFGRIKAAGVDPTEYIGVYNLRSYDRLADPALVRQMESTSGVKWEAVQAALARLYMGDSPLPREARANTAVRFQEASTGESIKKDETKNKPAFTDVPIPDSTQAAREVITKWKQAYPSGYPTGEGVAHCALHGGDLMREPWAGSEIDEKQAYVTEEKYPHSKVMVVDDRVLLIGSANINERSQLGDRDSEIAIVIEDTDLGRSVESRMDGQKYMAGRFAFEFRKKLMKMHLGLLPPQDVPFDKGVVTPAMHEIGAGPYYVEDEFDALVQDPLSDEFLNLWNTTARNNTEHFENVFHCVPSNKVATWSEYQKWIPQAPQKVGHIYDPNTPLETIKRELSAIKGALVEMPLEFLANEDLLKLSGSVNPMTISIYV